MRCTVGLRQVTFHGPVVLSVSPLAFKVLNTPEASEEEDDDDEVVVPSSAAAASFFMQ